MIGLARPEVTGRASGARYLPARAVLDRYGVTSMSISRWLADEAMNFPRPVYFGRFRYWLEAELEDWERSRPRGRVSAKRRASDAEQTASAAGG
jgi:predicted DNA-binding transcriptional regulator AlpA